MWRNGSLTPFLHMNSIPETRGEESSALSGEAAAFAVYADFQPT